MFDVNSWDEKAGLRRDAGLRAVVSYVEVQYQMSERHACRLMGLGRLTHRYRARKAERDSALRTRLKELAAVVWNGRFQNLEQISNTYRVDDSEIDLLSGCISAVFNGPALSSSAVLSREMNRGEQGNAKNDPQNAQGRPLKIGCGAVKGWRRDERRSTHSARGRNTPTLTTPHREEATGRSWRKIPISLIMRRRFSAKPQECQNEADERANRSEKGGQGEK